MIVATHVARGLVPRADPSGRRDGMWAPQRVDPRGKPGDDRREFGHDAGKAAA
jgi:hypothetical protein